MLSRSRSEADGLYQSERKRCVKAERSSGLLWERVSRDDTAGHPMESGEQAAEPYGNAVEHVVVVFDVKACSGQATELLFKPLFDTVRQSVALQRAHTSTLMKLATNLTQIALETLERPR
jgi:hypothetical protein